MLQRTQVVFVLVILLCMTYESYQKPAWAKGRGRPKDRDETNANQLQADAPTDAPAVPPTDAPTVPPTDAPTVPPTDAPTDAPTVPPTDAPTDAPTVPPTTTPLGKGNSPKPTSGSQSTDSQGNGNSQKPTSGSQSKGKGKGKKRSQIARIKIKKPDTQQEALEFLIAFGYLNNDTALEDVKVKQKMKEFQRMARLRPTGILDEATKTRMGEPRCGDIDQYEDYVNYTDYDYGNNTDNFTVTRMKRFEIAMEVMGDEFKWDHNDISYRYISFTSDFGAGSENAVRNVIVRALAHWSEVSPLTFHEDTTSDHVDITFAFTALHTYGDEDGDFDGPGGVTAHAFTPKHEEFGCVLCGDTHFDEAEEWTDRSKTGTNLLQIAIHEIGHALGMLHSYVWGSVMYPYVLAYDPNYSLHEDDISAIQAIYGAKK